MSMKTLPLLFINLGGEMLYILDQRLKAQNIPQEKAKKVMHDITGTMLNKRFMEELFKPQELYSKKAMRTVFDRLAHASIMRLNAASMDKLYDLMTMAFKYQISLCLRPKDILLVTLNHMDAIRSFVDGAGPIQEQVDNVYRLLIEHYASIQPGEFMLVRQTLLNFFQDMHIRVSIFLKDKVQSSNGRFILPNGGQVPYGTDMPGTIKMFDGSGKTTQTAQFNAIGKFQACQKEGSFNVHGDRVTKLGTNMYSVARPVETTVTAPAAAPVKSSSSHRPVAAAAAASVPEPDYGANANPLAKQQLDLLSKLIGGGGKAKSGKDFRLNLFKTDEEEEQAAIMRPAAEPGSQVVTIDASRKSQSRELSKIMGELNVESGNHDEDDLLDLMDSTQ